MTSKDRRDELFANAMLNLMKDKLGISIDLLDEIIHADSDDRLAVLARGSVYLKMGNTKNAIDDFSRALEIDSLKVKRNPSKIPASRITQGVYCCYGR
jgi:tetratricopeptide (TPR) repeat protein